MKWQQGKFTITDQFADLDLDLIHGFLCGQSYWSKGIAKPTVEQALQHSLCFGLFDQDQQIGFGRAITDRATFAYFADVFVIKPYRGRGLGKWLIASMLKHPDLQNLRRILLATQDGHGLYRQHGFTPLRTPERFMEIHRPEIYSVGSVDDG